MTVATKERAKIRGELRSRSSDRAVERRSSPRADERSIRKLVGRLKFEHYAMAKALANGARVEDREARIRRLEAKMDRLLGVNADGSENAPERAQRAGS